MLRDFGQIGNHPHPGAGETGSILVGKVTPKDAKTQLTAEEENCFAPSSAEKKPAT